MNPVSIGISRHVRGSLCDFLRSRGYRIRAVDEEPYAIHESSTEERFICARRLNGVVLTILEGDQHPDMSFVTISSDFWLLLRHGNVTFDQEIVSELAGMISGVNWAFENAESDADREQVQSILRGEDVGS